VPTESIKNDSTYLMPLGIIPKQHLKTAFRRTLQIASSLLSYEPDPTASVKHQRQVFQVPLTKGRDICSWSLNELDKRRDRDLLPPISATYEYVVDVLRFTGVGRLTNALNRLRRARGI
jgi:hypothetical protein